MGIKQFVSCRQLGSTVHKHFFYYPSMRLTLMFDWPFVFHVLRDGIVARFVATDGGITRVYPRRYSPLFLLSFTSSV